MPLARPGKFDDSSGDDTVGELVNKAEGNTSPFERDPQNPLRFEIGIEVVEVSRDGHANPAEGHLMLDASDLLSGRRQPAAVSGSLERQTDILAKNNCNIISLMETINDTYAPRAASTQRSTSGLTYPRQGVRADRTIRWAVEN
jgi:hypothetical protein